MPDIVKTIAIRVYVYAQGEGSSGALKLVWFSGTVVGRWVFHVWHKPNIHMVLYEFAGVVNKASFAHALPCDDTFSHMPWGNKPPRCSLIDTFCV